MKILVLQHARIEHPGKFRDFLREDGHVWDAIMLDEGQKLPTDVSGYDALWVLGGPMDVWQEKEYPWLKEEKAFIRRTVIENGMPFLGVCLGHQLLAEALGGSVALSKAPEIGVMDVNLTEAGLSGVFFDGLDEAFPVLQWHSAEVTALPRDCQILAASSACAVQAFSWARCAFGVQFHLEAEVDTVENWRQIPQYEEALIKSLGAQGAARLEADCAKQQKNFERNAERVYINWMQSIARA